MDEYRFLILTDRNQQRKKRVTSNNIDDFAIEFDDDFMSNVIDYYQFLSIFINFVD